MKFVHLTTRVRVAAILANGIRKGRGRRGVGTYAVPLVMLRFPDPANQDPGRRTPIQSQPRTSAHLWRWWRKRDRAAIVFEAPAHAWPADLYLLVPRGMHRSVRANARALGLPSQREPRVVGLEKPFLSGDLHIVVQDARSLGKVLRPFLARIDRLDSWEIRTAVEVVFRAPIPANCIRRVATREQTSTGKKILRGGRRQPRAAQRRGWGDCSPSA